jgi:asparagine synthase (glutamine-hydrolysing)
MSGFAAVFNLDGAPVDRARLEEMASFLSFRGPDGREVWVSGSAAMCHTLLRTSAKSDGTAPILHRGSLSMTGDARIDDRETLIAKLSPRFPTVQNASSAELVLFAYETWGDSCLDHLLGDFSFVIWDARRQRVFAARDQLGVRPLFYALVGQCLAVSNTLECLRQLPIVSRELNERAIADFLLVGRNHQPSETYFSAIQRLPVAHRLVADAEGLQTERYWSVPIDEPVYYKSSGDYVKRFQELLRAAVRDRLPDGPLGVFMSGGLDSPALAASAVALGASVKASTSVWDRLIPDQERHYAGLVAQHLNIAISYNVRDDEPWGLEIHSKSIHTSEPSQNPLNAEAYRRYAHGVCKDARVFFWGDGPDAALLYEWRSHFSYLMRQRKFGRICQDLALHAKAFKRVPLLSTLPSMWKERPSSQPDWYAQSFPRWVNPELVKRLDLKRRWEELLGEQPSAHPVRKGAYTNFASDSPMDWDTGNGGAPGDPVKVELHPFWDLRLLRFLLSVPVVPWCRDKFLIRTAMRGLLPDAVRLRPKTALVGSPYLLRIRQVDKPGLPPSPVVEQYVDPGAVPEWPGGNRQETDQALRVLGLHYWLLGAYQDPCM